MRITNVKQQLSWFFNRYFTISLKLFVFSLTALNYIALGEEHNERRRT